MAYVEGSIHTDTIEETWSVVKRAIFGQHHHYTREHAAAYIVEARYKCNNRKIANTFDDFLAGTVMV
ncbi:MAG: transposase [Caldilineaceae bacterium]|nr:transposase [Caldilineaceae bacterium]